jgi:hypothetical protein
LRYQTNAPTTIITKAPRAKSAVTTAFLLGWKDCAEAPVDADCVLVARRVFVFALVVLLAVAMTAIVSFLTYQFQHLSIHAIALASNP